MNCARGFVSMCRIEALEIASAATSTELFADVPRVARSVCTRLEQRLSFTTIYKYASSRAMEPIAPSALIDGVSSIKTQKAPLSIYLVRMTRLIVALGWTVSSSSHAIHRMHASNKATSMQLTNRLTFDLGSSCSCCGYSW